MNETLVRHRGFFFVFPKDLPETAIDALLALTRNTTKRSGTTLSGRGGISYGTLPGIGPVVAKHYLRGGVLRHFVRSWHLMTTEPRSLTEYRLLERVRSIGINAPRPLACCWRGRHIYQAWLFMDEILDYKSLADVSLEEPERLSKIFSEVERQMALLVANNILHIDLHPGNVIVDTHGTVYLLDFDKAREYSGTTEELRDQFIFRWRRAVIKHNLPEELSEMFCCAMRQIQCKKD